MSKEKILIATTHGPDVESVVLVVVVGVAEVGIHEQGIGAAGGQRKKRKRG